jgi:type I restriction enzyme, R subunit
VEFVNMVIDYLTERGVMDPRLLYESPFTDLDPLGVAGLFKQGEAAQLIQILRDVQGRAAT